MKKLIIILSLFPILAFGQVNLDSLWGVWNDLEQPDTNRLKAIRDICWLGYMRVDLDSAFLIAQMEYDFAKKVGNKKFMAQAINMQGVSMYKKGNYIGAIDLYNQSLDIKKEIGDQQGVAASIINIGLIYKNQGDYKSAIDCYTQSLKIYEELDDKQGISASYTSIGLLYKNLGNYDKALEYLTKSLLLKEELGNDMETSWAYHNIGIVYKDLGNVEKALDYYDKSLQIKIKVGDKVGIGATLNNIGIVQSEQGDYTSALENLNESLKIKEELGDQKGMAETLVNLGDVYKKKGEYNKTLLYCERALNIAEGIGLVAEMRNASQSLWEVHKKLGNYKESLSMHELYITMRDSIQNEESQKEIIKQEYKHAYEKQAAADSTKAAEAAKVMDAQLEAQEAKTKQQETVAKAQKRQNFYLYIGLVLVAIFGVFMYNRFRVTQQQKKTIEQQKIEGDRQRELITAQHHELEEKNQEVMDSIRYAQRIQQALLKSEEHQSPHLPEHFILFKPKDIVSGDFYWALEKQGYIYIAAADCTGHGVPGAFLTMLGTSFLNEINAHDDLLSPAEILDELRDRIIKELSQTGAEGESKDGMDISLIRLNLKTNELQWSGANNPLYLIRDGEITETKADKQAIGFGYEMTPFTNHEMQLHSGDYLTIFSDGYADQFGGPKGKKYKYSTFKQRLLDIHLMSMKEQKRILSEEFEEWKGELEQIDDVCVISVRV